MTTLAPSAIVLPASPVPAYDMSLAPYTDSPTQAHQQASVVSSTAPTGSLVTAPPTSTPTSAELVVDSPSNEESESATSTTTAVDEADSAGTIAAGTVSVFVALAVLLAGATSMHPTSTDDRSLHVSKRTPAETLAFMALRQLQFLAMLSMVDSTADDDSVLSDFVTNLRWVNLWWEPDVVSTSAAEDEDVVAASVLKAPRSRNGGSAGSVSEQCKDAADGIGLLVGTITLFSIILLAVIIVHVTVISGIEAFWLAKKRALANVEEMRQRGGPISEQITQASGRPCPPRTTDQDGSGEAEGGELLLTSGQSRVGPIEECRNRSQSAWLHFPHLELLFLFFAFEGVVAAAASVIEHSGCPAAFYPALVILVLYPILMITAVWRTIKIRIHPDTVLVFNHYDGEADTDIEVTSKRVLSKLQTSLVYDHSLFAWADRGEWETAGSGNPRTFRERDWFRIGFEPLYVDYTKPGTYFILVCLGQWAALSCIGALVNSSTSQLVLFCLISLAMAVVLLWLKPFSNTMINKIAVGMEAANAVCVAVIAGSSFWWDETDHEDRASGSVVLIEMVVLCVLIIPVYIDAVVSLAGAIRTKMRRALTKTDQEKAAQEEEVKRYIRDHILRTWGFLWCRMLRYNMFAFAHDIRQGVRNPDASPAAA